MRTVFRLTGSGLLAGVAMLVAALLTFGPAQALLADPELQSAKFVAAFAEEPLPRMAEHPWLLPAAFLGLGFAHAPAFLLLRRGLPASWPRAGAVYGVAAWLIAYPWFEYYLPWNVMREPLPLVALELACWLAVMLAGGQALAFANRDQLG